MCWKEKDWHLILKHHLEFFLHEGSQLDLLRPLKPLKNTRTIEDVQVIAIDWEFAFVTIKDILIVYFK